MNTSLASRSGFGRRAARGVPETAAPLADETPLSPLYRLRPGELWRAMQRQPASFWLLNAYLFFEYVRPQVIYDSIKGWPLASWAIYSCLAALFLEGHKLRRWSLADTGLVVYSIIILASTLTAWSPAASRAGYNLWFSWMVIYWMITTLVNSESRFLLFLLWYFLLNAKMSQHGVRGFIEAGGSFRSWGATGGPGWFRNSGEFGIEMTIFVPMAVFFVLALRRYWTRRTFWVVMFLPVSGLISIIATSSRGAQLAIAAVGLWFILKSPHRIRALVIASVSAGALFVLLPEGQKQRFTEMGTDKTSLSRLTYWADAREMMSQYPVLGIGYNNWIPYYRTYYNADGELPHNIFYQAGAELGFTGLVGFIGLIIITLIINYRTRKLASELPDGGRFALNMAHGLDGALIGFLVSGYFVTVLYYPFFWINLAFTVALHNSTRNEIARHALRTQPPPLTRLGTRPALPGAVRSHAP